MYTKRPKLKVSRRNGNQKRRNFFALSVLCILLGIISIDFAEGFSAIASPRFAYDFRTNSHIGHVLILRTEFPEEEILSLSPLKPLTYAFVMSIGVFAGIYFWFLNRTTLATYGIAACLLFIPGVLLSLYILFTNGSRIVLRPTGLQICIIRCFEPIAWTNIRNFQVCLVGYNILVCYEKLERSPSYTRQGNWKTAFLPDLYGFKPNELAAVLREYQRRSINLNGTKTTSNCEK